MVSSCDILRSIGSSIVVAVEDDRGCCWRGAAASGVASVVLRDSIDRSSSPPPPRCGVLRGEDNGRSGDTEGGVSDCCWVGLREVSTLPSYPAAILMEDGTPLPSSLNASPLSPVLWPVLGLWAELVGVVRSIRLAPVVGREAVLVLEDMALSLWAGSRRELGKLSH